MYVNTIFKCFYHLCTINVEASVCIIATMRYFSICMDRKQIMVPLPVCAAARSNGKNQNFVQGIYIEISILFEIYQCGKLTL